MNLTGNAWRELSGISERLARLLPNPDQPLANAEEECIAPDWCPSVDVSETEEAFEVKVELPGVTRDDVRISMEDGVLAVQGERKQGAGSRMHRVERPYGRFLRSFVVPDTVDGSQVKAMCKDGILYLHLPKIERSTPQAIEVQAA
jgi:HSP20 family protein